MEHMLRAAVIATRLADVVGLDAGLRPARINFPRADQLAHIV